MDRNSQSRALSRRRGFALVLTVALLALLVLIVVALATLTRVETAAARNSGYAAEARQNALAGLNVALGRLQVLAGPDRRVTANAELLAATSLAPHPGNVKWCGVWDSTATSGGPLAWLVSGAGAADHTISPPSVGDGASDGVRLVGDGSSDVAFPGNEVVVRRETIAVNGLPAAAGPATVGRFAFWVGDEGVKANVAVIDRVDEVPVPASPAADDPVKSIDDRARLRQLFAHRAGNDALNFTGQPHGFQLLAENDAQSAARWEAFGTVLDDAQLRFQFLASASAGTSYRKFLRRDFHALTVSSLGLLCDTARGGLRSNWSDLRSAPTEVRDLENYRPLPGARLGVSAGNASTGQPAFQVKPLVTELALDFVPYRDAAASGATSGRLLLGVRLRVELWNPYNLPLAHSPIGTADYELRIGGTRTAGPTDCGLPLVGVRTPAQPTLNVGSFDLRGMMPAGLVVPLDCAGDLAAGETVVVESLLGTAIDAGLMVDDTQPTDAADDVLECMIMPDPSRVLGFELRRANGIPGEAPLTVFADFPSGAATRTSTGGWSVPANAPFAGASPLRELGFSYHFRLDPARVRWGDWIAPTGGTASPHDLRANRLSGATGEWTSVGSDPADNARRSGQQFEAAELFAVGHVLRMADFTRQRNLSLGALSQLAHPGERPSAIGQPWGAARNEVFDRAFFAPVPASWTDGQRLPNTRLRLLSHGGVSAAAADLRGSESARFLGADGMFNVNSVEPDAWTVVLGRSVLGWSDSAGATVAAMENPWFNFPQSAADARPPFRGRRTFSDAAVQTLSGEIVAGLRARGRPLGSLAEFVNSGLLQAAIDSAGWNTTPAFVADVGGPPAPYEPDFVTQATLLNALAPVLAVRSDTFRIRVCGEAVNPGNSAVAARAYAEAIVQRYPEPIVAGAMVMGDAPGYGRRFRIVAFRWMNEADL